MKNSTKKIIISISVVVVVLATIIGGFFIYVGDYYKADETALNALNSNELVKVEFNNDKGYYAFIPNVEYTSAFIFIPGGKVECTAYAPLMQKIAQEGVLCILLKVKFNLAILDQNAPKGIKEDFNEVEKWSIGGHSLGGAVACLYVNKHIDEFQGLVLMGSFPSKDLSESNLDCVAIYGSNDKVMKKHHFEDNIKNFPKLTTVHEINGGNHAFFGSYGEQKGDGKATISNATQIELAANYSLMVVA